MREKLWDITSQRPAKLWQIVLPVRADAATSQKAQAKVDI